MVRSAAERNFHVFYQLLSSGGSLKGTSLQYILSCYSNIHASADTLLLDQPLEEYEFLNKSKREVDGVNDCEDWDALIVRVREFEVFDVD